MHMINIMYVYHNIFQNYYKNTNKNNVSVKWNGLLAEMELVPSVHPKVECDGCGQSPLAGSRY